MSKWQPITLPLVEGQDDGSSSVQAKPGIDEATNVEFGLAGTTRGRPGYRRNSAFGLRGYNAGVLSDPGTVSLVTTGFTPVTLFRYRDGNAERPGLVSRGRTWTYENDRWTDRLFGGATKFTRVVDSVTNVDPSLATHTPTIAYNYGHESGVSTAAMLLGSNGSPETFLNYTGAAAGLRGGTARVTTGGHDYHCTFVVNQAATSAQLLVRRDYDHAITRYDLTASMVAAIRAPLGVGDYPVVCADFDTSVLYVCAMTATKIQLMRVDPTNGSVLTNVNFTPGVAPTAIWITNTSAATNRLVVAWTDGTTGVKTKIFSASALADQALDLTLTGAQTAKTVVCGVAESNQVWVCATMGTAVPRGLNLWTRSISAATQLGVFTFDNTGATDVTACTASFQLMHQPVKCGGRTVLGAWIGSVSLLSGTYHGLDLTNLVMAAGSVPAGTAKPGLLARGPETGTFGSTNPVTAVLPSATATSYRFACNEGRTFVPDTIQTGVTFGSMSAGLTQVEVMGPQTDAIGEETVIGGSAPHLLAKGYVAEVGFMGVGFPFLTAAVLAGAGGTPGSYIAQAVWRWTDEAGQIHRSAPSLPVPFTTTGGNTNVRFGVSTPVVTEREYGVMQIELYITEVAAVAASPKYLFKTVAAAATGSQDILAAALITSAQAEPLYTNGGVFQNMTVSADGGVVTMGRRMWLSDGESAYASKLLRAGYAPAWNNEGSLVVTPPATAGRIVGLQAMDDKVILLCERGIYMTQGEGPDDLGIGPDFLVPYKVADIGCAGPLSSDVTDKGVVFHTTNSNNFNFSSTSTDGAYGGLWVLDRGLSLAQVSAKVLATLGNVQSPIQLSYLPERQVLYCLDSENSQILMWDLRVNQWSVWLTPDSESVALSVQAVGGVLWQLAAEAGTYNNTRGVDFDGSASTNVAMVLTTTHMPTDGGNGLGWARVRSLRVLGEQGGAHTLTVAVQATDQSNGTHAVDTVNFSMPASTTTADWPHNRYAPERRLPSQKCSSLQVALTAIPANAVWTALELLVQPLGRAPANQRA